MIDFTLTEEQQALQLAAREFAEQEIKPISKARESIPDPWERFPWDLLEKGSKLGFRTLAVPREFGGGGANTFDECLMNEEFAAADLGVATIFDQASRLFHQMFRFFTSEQRDTFLIPLLSDHRALLAIGGTEPQAGSDTWLPYDEPGAGAQAFAERRGDTYLLNAHKTFISLGPVARLYLILARTDRQKRYSEGGLSAFIVPRDTPGFSIGTIWEKTGQHLILNADLLCENVVLPVGNRVLEEGAYFPALQRFMRGGNAEAAALCLGIGRAAYEAAASYARQRVQGGKPIIEHQAIGMMLADMATRIETARLLTWKAAWAADNMEPFDFRLPSMSKVYASEAAFDVSRMAMEIHGGSGIMKNLPIEKYLRDASTMLHSDGTNQVHRLRVARRIKLGA
ncbi:MAG: acyl-CoA/acyl-ACP dehydrogenase [Chloroflexi bacterium]|nr:acyl-CoA/acyl-ACP dehydrogenase [Chloroflexota bacterium]